MSVSIIHVAPPVDHITYQLILFVLVKKTVLQSSSKSVFTEISPKENKMRVLRTFTPTVSAHPYCTRNSLRDVMPRHALSVHAVEEIWRYIALVGTLISMHGFNSLKCSVTPYFLLIDHFLCQLSTFCEKLMKICIVEV